MLWSVAGLVVLVLGEVVEGLISAEVAFTVVVGFAVAFVVFSGKDHLLSGLIASLLLASIARSTLSTPLLTTTTPLVIAALLLLAAVIDRRTLSIPRGSVLVVVFAGMLVITTVAQSDLETTAKSAGIAIMWILVFFSCANLMVGARSTLLRVFIGLGCVQAVLAIGESLLKLDMVRSFVVGSTSDAGYIVRQNLILGEWTNRAQGTLGHPIPFASVLVVALLALVFSAAVSRLSLKIPAAALIFLGIALSGARSAFVALALGFFAYCISLIVTSGRRSWKEPRLRLAALATAPLVAGGFFFLVRAVLTGDFSLLHRGAVIDAAWELHELPLGRFIFGSGYDSATRLYEAGFLHTDGLEVIDNAVISQLVTSGLVGVALLLALFVFGMKWSSHAGRAALAGAFGFLFFFDAFSWHIATVLTFGMIGYASARATEVAAQRAQDPAPEAHQPEPDSSRRHAPR
jgi:hypothetical protein